MERIVNDEKTPIIYLSNVPFHDNCIFYKNNGIIFKLCHLCVEIKEEQQFYHYFTSINKTHIENHYITNAYKDSIKRAIDDGHEVYSMSWKEFKKLLQENL